MNSNLKAWSGSIDVVITGSMATNNDIRHGRHCVFLMHAHLVFVTRYMRGVFTKEILDDIRVVFSSVCSDFEAELIEFGGEDDHVHLRMNYPPKVAVSVLVNSLKGVSSRMIRKKNYPNIRQRAVSRFNRFMIAVLFSRIVIMGMHWTPDR